MFVKPEGKLALKLETFDDPYNDLDEVNPYFHRRDIRCMSIGGSGSGKTTWMMNMIKNQIDWNKIIIIAPETSVNQYMYTNLYEKYLQLEKELYEQGYFQEEHEEEDENGDITIKPRDELIQLRYPDDVPKVEDLDKDKRYLIVIDDIFDQLTKAQYKNITALLNYGSKRRVHIFILVQQLDYLKNDFKKMMNACYNYMFTRSYEPNQFNYVITKYFKEFNEFDMMNITGKMKGDEEHKFPYVIFTRDTNEPDKKVFINETIYIPYKDAHATKGKTADIPSSFVGGCIYQNKKVYREGIFKNEKFISGNVSVALKAKASTCESDYCRQQERAHESY